MLDKTNSSLNNAGNALNTFLTCSAKNFISINCKGFIPPINKATNLEKELTVQLFSEKLFVSDLSKLGIK